MNTYYVYGYIDLSFWRPNQEDMVSPIYVGNGETQKMFEDTGYSYGDSKFDCFALEFTTRDDNLIVEIDISLYIW